jgi:hypothetical protein
MGKFQTNRIDFASITAPFYPPVGEFIIGLDLADDVYKKMDSNGVLTVIGASSGPSIRGKRYFVAASVGSHNASIGFQPTQLNVWTYDGTTLVNGATYGTVIWDGTNIYQTCAGAIAPNPNIGACGMLGNDDSNYRQVVIDTMYSTGFTYTVTQVGSPTFTNDRIEFFILG